MYTVEPYKVEIRLIDKNGIVMVYPDYDTFLNNVTYYFIERYIVDTCKEWPNEWYNFWEPEKEYKRYIVRDEFGSVYTNTEILHDKRTLNNIYRGYRINKPHQFIYRYSPIPFTGKKHYSFGNWYKKPKITQEKRWSLAHKEYVRGKRRNHNLPDPWDDHQRSDVRERKSWKHYKKKKQWL